MHTEDFTAKRISRTVTIVVHGNVDIVFPLFGAFEERKWAEGWKPNLIYPSKEVIEEGTTFTTKGSSSDEPEFLWRVSKYEPEKYLIQYLVSTANRYWTITVRCSPEAENITHAEITYSYIGLNNLGNSINEDSLEKMYFQNLKDWEKAINYFLKTGKTLLE